MREAVALIRANWLTQTSYRLRLVLSMAALLVPIIPVYFVAQTIQPIIADSIADQGGQYFGFLVAGMITMSFLSIAVNTLPTQVGSGIRTGTLEAVLSTPARLWSLLIGSVGFGLTWTGTRTAVVLIAAWALGAHVAWGKLVPAAIVLLLISATYLSFGVLAAALVLAFRTAGPLPRGVLYVSILLGGVYYPTKVIPSWIESIADWIPLTYGLRALRRLLLDGAAFSTVLPDVLTLSAFGLALSAASVAAFAVALRYAKRSGTLAQY